MESPASPSPDAGAAPAATFSAEQAQAMVSAAVEATIKKMAGAPDASSSLKEMGGDPEAKALNYLKRRVKDHQAGREEFTLADARAFIASLPDCELTKVWRLHHGRPPREVGSMYPVRQFGGKVFSTFPISDSHHSGHTPQYE